VLLEARGVRAGYEADVLEGVDLALEAGALFAVLGPNGAGKSTLLAALAGVLRVRSGSVHLAGVEVTNADPAELARCGLYLLREGRGTFPSLTVAENLRLGSARPEREQAEARARVDELFPRLVERRDQLAGTLSGGERQMLALARAFVAAPLVLLLDEPSLGLAPKVVEEVFGVIATLRAEGVSIVLVEQYATRALAVADRAAVLAGGRLRPLDVGDAGAREALAAGYLGGGHGVAS
jgi:branched-chain amino acid transport system ATP-binding protein